MNDDALYGVWYRGVPIERLTRIELIAALIEQAEQTRQAERERIALLAKLEAFTPRRPRWKFWKKP